MPLSQTGACLLSWTAPFAPGLSQDFDSALGNHIHAVIQSDGNSSLTEYAIQYAQGGTWLQGDGSAGASQVWKTAAQWTLSHASGLQDLSGNLTASAKTVSVRLPHFSVFAIMGTPGTSLADAHPFPVPFVPANGDTNITFTGLSGVATIRIFTMSGELMQTLEESDGDGQRAWDVKSSDGTPLYSGVYLYQIKSVTDEKRGKLIVVR